MYLSNVYWVHICEKQLLKLIMNLLIYYTLTDFVYLALKDFPSADIARQTPPPFVVYPDQIRSSCCWWCAQSHYRIAMPVQMVLKGQVIKLLW